MKKLMLTLIMAMILFMTACSYKGDVKANTEKVTETRRFALITNGDGSEYYITNFKYGKKVMSGSVSGFKYSEAVGSWATWDAIVFNSGETYPLYRMYSSKVITWQEGNINYVVHSIMTYDDTFTKLERKVFEANRADEITLDDVLEHAKDDVEIEENILPDVDYSIESGK